MSEASLSKQLIISVMGLNLAVCPSQRRKCVSGTGGIERFSAQECFGKILKVSHFNLRFSLDINNNQIKPSQRVS